MFDLKQIIFYMRDSRVHSAPVLARVAIDNAHEDWVCTSEQENLFSPFGNAGIRYGTCHGIVFDEEAYATREELIASL